MGKLATVGLPIVKGSHGSAKTLFSYQVKVKENMDDRKKKQDESFFSRMKRWFEEVDDHDLK